MNNRNDLEHALDHIEKQFHQATLKERLKLLFAGLRAPRGSREYKLARIESQRLAAPALAVLLPLFIVALIAFIAVKPKAPQDEFPTVKFNPQQPEEQKILQTTDPIKTDPVEPDNTLPNITSINVDVPTPPDTDTYDPPPAVTPIPIPLYKPLPLITGDPLPPNNDTPKEPPPVIAEDAVLRGLRWLKQNQNADGSWSANKPAMTGLALLCFLAHDETPAESVEFGDTVRRGLEFLVTAYDGNTFRGTDGNEYAYLIASYALCEAYGMTQNPNIRAVVEPAFKRIIESQHPSGGWDYKLARTDRDDTSYMGWAAQALKVAQLANLFAGDPEWRAKLDKACKLSNNGFLKNGASGGGFGYTSPGRGGLTAVGVLCMQFHGGAKHKQVTDSLKLMDAWKPGWLANIEDVKKLGLGESLQYYYYYATQAKFLVGGKSWNTWNDVMVSTYESAQKIKKNAIADPKGDLVDIGWWENVDNHSDRPVMDTCLAVLQLEVYYRGNWTKRLAVATSPELPVDYVVAETTDLAIDTKGL